VTHQAESAMAPRSPMDSVARRAIDPIVMYVTRVARQH
jgi:hypothetical protein